jgi:hypothetical protein
MVRQPISETAETARRLGRCRKCWLRMAHLGAPWRTFEDEGVVVQGQAVA